MDQRSDYRCVQKDNRVRYSNVETDHVVYWLNNVYAQLNTIFDLYKYEL